MAKPSKHQDQQNHQNSEPQPTRKLRDTIVRHKREQASWEKENAKKKKPKSKRRATQGGSKQRAPEVLQKMIGVLAYLILELDPERPGFMKIRYRLFSALARAKNYGYAADILIAIVRIIDRLRMDHAGCMPKYLKQIAIGDLLTVAQLLSSYPKDHPIWRLDISAFMTINLNECTEKQFVESLIACIIANFKFAQQTIETKRIYKFRECVSNTVGVTVRRAFKNREEWEMSSPDDQQIMVRCAGWKNSTQERWNDCNGWEVSGPHINRMIRVAPKTCVKGGPRA
ncbi:MAG: hypothetical protein V4819_24060 [Verrucomicrobiota bacterium]